MCVCATPWAIKRNNKAHEAYFTHVFVAFITISSSGGSSSAPRLDCWHATPPAPSPYLRHNPHLLPTYEILKQTRRIRGNFYCIFLVYAERENIFFFSPIVCKSACHADVPPCLPLRSLSLSLLPNVAKFLITWPFSCTGE